MTSPESPISSLIESHPQHVGPIGELAVEFNSMDVILGWFFGFVCNIDNQLAHIIFHTPRAYFTRVEMLENAIDNQFTSDSQPYKTAKGIAARYRKVIDKRHRLIHDTWGTDHEGAPVRRSLPYLIRHEPTPVEQNDLKRLLADMRALTAEVYDLLPDWAIVPKMEKRTAWHERS
jgi:hypothetical protein